MQKKVIIESSPESGRAYGEGWAVVAVDVIRATTSAVTAAARGGRCLPVSSLEAARRLAAQLENPLLAGEVNGEIPPGFNINNSPAELARRNLCGRPVILLSSSGTRLIHEAGDADAVYLACLRNYRHTARHISGRHARIAVIGAGTRGEFRIEDQICCAWIAGELVKGGYLVEDERTREILEGWENADPEVIANGRSADYLRRTGQVCDLNFVLGHLNDLDATFRMNGPEVAMVAGVPNQLPELQPAVAPATRGVPSW